MLDSTKVRAYPYKDYYPNISSGEVMAIKYTYPVIIRWDTSLFQAPYLPISPPINVAVFAGDYVWNIIDPTAPRPHCLNMFNHDSLFCESDIPGPNPTSLFNGGIGFDFAYDPFLAI